jgi:hypothetical protein
MLDKERAMAFDRAAKEVNLPAEKTAPVSAADIFKFSESDNIPWQTKSGGELKQNPYINEAELKNFLGTLQYPLYHLDFETFGYSEKIPFQYSLHIQDAPKGEPKHKEFLAEPGSDPRRALAESLCRDIPADAMVIAYNMSFEKGRIKELADLYPDLAGHLMKIHDNCKDLMTPFQKGYYYHEDFGSSYSLKTILPVLFLDDKSLDYTVLKNIHNGKEAMDAGAELYSPDVFNKYTDNQIAEMRQDLLDYCRLDTLAMVKILDKLYESAPNTKCAMPQESFRFTGEPAEFSEKEKIKANEIKEKALVFVQENSKTPQEQKIAGVLREMQEAGKIKVVDTIAEIGFPVYGYYDPQQDIICLDINSLLDYGTAEAVDTLVHEGYHAAQNHAGHENDIVEEETRAWNAGLEMSNKYRAENGETIVRAAPYTQLDIYRMGYDYTLGPTVFTDLLVKGGIEA